MQNRFFTPDMAVCITSKMLYPVRITIFCNTLFSSMAEIKVLDFVYFSFDVGCVQQVVSLFASRLA